jgi:hypothetical protein
MLQGEVIVKNILSMIHGRPNLKEYNPHPFEGALQLTLGKVSTVSIDMTPTADYPDRYTDTVFFLNRNTK